VVQTGFSACRSRAENGPAGPSRRARGCAAAGRRGSRTGTTPIDSLMRWCKLHSPTRPGYPDTRACLGYALASRDDTPLGLHANRWRLPLKPAMLAAVAAGCRSGRLDLQPPDPRPAGRGSCRRASLRRSKSVSGLDVAYTTGWPGKGRGKLGRQRRPFR
jgi:hypothetical protein